MWITKNVWLMWKNSDGKPPEVLHTITNLIPLKHSVSLRSALSKVFFDFLYNREELLSKSLYVRLSAF